MSNTKSCTNIKCKQVNPQPLTCFSKQTNSISGYKSRCKFCEHDYRILQKSSINSTKTQYKINNHQAISEYTWKRYGIKNADGSCFKWFNYLILLEMADNKCQVCGTSEPTGLKAKWHIDHDHTTGIVRGILCHHCNVLLGFAKDNKTTLAKAIAYLERT